MVQLVRMQGLRRWSFGRGFKGIVVYVPAGLNRDHASHFLQNLGIMDEAAIMIYFDGSWT